MSLCFLVRIPKWPGLLCPLFVVGVGVIEAVEEDEFVFLGADSEVARVVVSVGHVHPVAVVGCFAPVFRLFCAFQCAGETVALHVVGGGGSGELQERGGKIRVVD